MVLLLKIDIRELENIADILIKNSLKTEDALNKLKNIYFEMSEDMELSSYLQSQNIKEAVSLSLESLNKTNDLLEKTKNIVCIMPAIYEEIEQTNKNRLNNLSDNINFVTTELDSIMLDEFMPSIEHNALLHFQNNLQQLVSDNCEEMKIVNFSAVTKLVEEEYGVKKIEILDSDL